jgi:hypothetical protein
MATKKSPASGWPRRCNPIKNAATNAAAQRPTPRVVNLGNKTEVFTLKDVKGPKENPAEVVLELTDSKKTVSLSKENSYREVAGYAADLRYEPGCATGPGRQVHWRPYGDRFS